LAEFFSPANKSEPEGLPASDSNPLSISEFSEKRRKDEECEMKSSKKKRTQLPFEDWRALVLQETAAELGIAND
jgi:hypothetical protein